MASKEELSSPLFARNAGAVGPSSREHALLRAVSKADGLNQTAIMAATGLDRSSTADLVRRLVSRGLLRRRRTRRDVRQYAIRLTEKGLDRFSVGRSRRQGYRGGVARNLQRTDRETLIAMLRAITQTA